MADYPYAALGGVLDAVALVAIFAIVVIAAFALLYLASLPGRIASRRSHPQAEAVNICGWVGLPTGGFWVVALVWAYWNHRGNNVVACELTDQISNLERSIAKLEEQRRRAT